jgi:UDP-N-acetylglucosamine:LPS N-acetylglucosamine transferase
MKKQKVMFISSLGGHLTQLLQLKSIFNNYDYVLITEKSDITKSLAKDYNIRYLKHTSRDNLLIFFGVVIANCFLSLYYFIKYNPRVIVSTGANTAAAMCCLGKMFGKKVIFIESFAKRTTPSITGKMIYKLHAYTTFVVQWKTMLKYYPKAKYWGGIY